MGLQGKENYLYKVEKLKEYNALGKSLGEIKSVKAIKHTGTHITQLCRT